METMTVEVAVPSDLFSLLGRTRLGVAASVKEFSVLGLYQERRISAGKAAESLEMSKIEFARLLTRKGIPYFDYAKDELEDEFRVVDDELRRADFRMNPTVYREVLRKAGE